MPSPKLAARRLPPRVAALIGVAVLAASVAVGFVAGGDFGGADRVADRRAEAGGLTPSPVRLEPIEGTGPTAPSFALPVFGTGDVLRLENFAGTPLVLNFWASWCPFCIEEMPGLEAVHQRFQGVVAFLGVDLQDDRGLAADLIERTGVTYPIAEDREGAFFAEIRGLGMPTTLLITADGHLAKKITGPIRADDLEKEILEHLLREAP